MPDQASQLRQLVLRAARQREAESLPPPRMVAVIEACRGLGATSIAAHLGRAMVEQGARVVLIGADLQHHGLAEACGVPEAASNYDPAIARHDIHEALFRAPGGVQIVPGVWDAETVLPSEKVTQQLLRQFQQLGRHADLLVLDLGASAATLLPAFDAAAEMLLLVTSPDAAAVMETYALIKKSLVARAGKGVELLVNLAESEREATEVYQRLDRSCRRFLGFGLEYAGHVPPRANMAASLAAVAARFSDGRSERPSTPRRAA
jgi:flagellar biosynthesis protein FlhG